MGHAICDAKSAIHKVGSALCNGFHDAIHGRVGCTLKDAYDGSIGTLKCGEKGVVDTYCAVKHNPKLLLVAAAMIIAPELAPVLIGVTGSALAGAALTGAIVGGGSGLIASCGCFKAGLRGALVGGLSGGLGSGLGSALSAGAGSSAGAGAGAAAGSAGAAAGSDAASAGDGLYGLGAGMSSAAGSAGAVAGSDAAAAGSAGAAAGDGLYGLGAGMSSTAATAGSSAAAGSLGSGFYCSLQQPTCGLTSASGSGTAATAGCATEHKALETLGHQSGNYLAKQITNNVLGPPGSPGTRQATPSSGAISCSAFYGQHPSASAKGAPPSVSVLNTGSAAGCSGGGILGALHQLNVRSPSACTPQACNPGCYHVTGTAGNYLNAGGTGSGFMPGTCGMAPLHAAHGGAIVGPGGLAEGGLPARHHPDAPRGHHPEFITGQTGYYARGRGTGQSDDIPAMLREGDYVVDADVVSSFGDGSSKAGAQRLHEFMGAVPHRAHNGQPLPAKIADGEVVFPGGFVAAIGNGSNKRGAQLLDRMREELRAHKRSAPDCKIPPKAKSPLEYIKMARG